MGVLRGDVFARLMREVAFTPESEGGWGIGELKNSPEFIAKMDDLGWEGIFGPPPVKSDD